MKQLLNPNWFATALCQWPSNNGSLALNGLDIESKVHCYTAQNQCMVSAIPPKISQSSLCEWSNPQEMMQFIQKRGSRYCSLELVGSHFLFEMVATLKVVQYRLQRPVRVLRGFPTTQTLKQAKSNLLRHILKQFTN